MFYKNLISIVRSVNRRISGVEFLFVLLSQLESPLSICSNFRKVKRNFKKNLEKIKKSSKTPEIRHFLFKLFLFFILFPYENDSVFGA